MAEANTEMRREWLGLLARNGPTAAELLGAVDIDTTHMDVRAPEIGSVMVRGRAGATGEPFNLGEMTVTRCSVRLPGGSVGHGYVQGRDAGASRAAALIDALMQTEVADRLEADVLRPMREREDRRRRQRQEKAAATKVDFFTMVRGENA